MKSLKEVLERIAEIAKEGEKKKEFFDVQLRHRPGNPTPQYTIDYHRTET